MRKVTAIVGLLSAVVLIGCVERTMTINSNPPGALVYLNDQEIGRTPVTKDFLWYGNYDVQVRKEGYHTINTSEPVIAPAYEWPPFDLLAELVPWRVKVHREFSYTLRPASTQPADAKELMQHATVMKSMLQPTERPKPTTQPTTQAAK